MSSESLFEMYVISKDDLIKAGTEVILDEMMAHANFITGGKVKSLSQKGFMDIFYVTISLDENDETNDTNGIKYYEFADDKIPFLTMGFADNGFFVTVALLRTIGHKV